MRKHFLVFILPWVVVMIVLGGIYAMRFYGKQRIVASPTVFPRQSSGLRSDIIVDNPQPNAVVSSPIHITGTVHGGGWFFEGVFPVRLMTETGNSVASASAQALTDWMSTGTIPFEATILYYVATDTPMVLVLHNDNESGLPQYDKEIRIPLIMRATNKSDTLN